MDRDRPPSRRGRHLPAVEDDPRLGPVRQHCHASRQLVTTVFTKQLMATFLLGLLLRSLDSSSRKDYPGMSRRITGLVRATPRSEQRCASDGPMDPYHQISHRQRDHPQISQITQIQRRGQARAPPAKRVSSHRMPFTPLPANLRDLRNLRILPRQHEPPVLKRSARQV